MAASGYTPILIYASGTATNVPLAANLTSSASGAELALNYADGKLYYKNSSGVVTLLSASGGGPAGGSNTQVQFNSSGVLAGSASFTWDGTTLVTPSHTTNTATTGSTNKGPLNYGTLSFSDTGIVQSAQTSVNSYFQNVIQNTGAGTAASAEFIAYNDQGTASTNYATVGINSSGYTGTGSINAPGYAYFLSASTDLVLGTIGANAIHFTTNSAAADAITISSSNVVTILKDALINGITVGRGAGAVSTNTAVGASALTTNSTGAYNSAFGSNALQLNSTGVRNTAMGFYALYANTGDRNTAVGMQTLNSNTSGSYNTALGSDALGANTTASNNTAVGYQAGYSNTTGARLTAIGLQAGYSNNADNNTFVGQASGYSNTSGANNTFLGQASGNATTTGGSNTAIGKDALVSNTTASNNTAVGYQAAYANTTGSFIDAFGSGALSSNTTGNGNAAFGRATLSVNTTGSENSAFGTSSATYAPLRFNTTGSYNVAVGGGALASNTTASRNTAVGYQTSYLNTTGTDNVSIGYRPLYSNTTGGANIAMGSDTLGANTTGNYNSALGYNSLYNNTTASNNTAVGYQAGYSTTTGARNVFLGYQAGYTFTAGSTATYGSNVCLGASSGYSLTSGISNTLIGDQAGYGLTTGSANTFVGGGLYGTTGASGSLITTGSKNSILGNYSGNQGGLDIRTSSNYIVLSDGDGNPRQIIDSSGNLGLGVTPSAWVSGRNCVEIGGSVQPSIAFNGSTVANGGGIWTNGYNNGTNNVYKATGTASRLDTGAGGFAFYLAPSGTAGNAITFTQAMTLDASGNLLVGSTSVVANANNFVYSPGNAWGIFGHVNGTASGIDFTKFYYNGAQIGSISQSGTTAVLYNLTSDQRLKTNIADAAPASALIDAIQVRQYDWKSDGSHQRYGFIAQELVTVAPEAVHQPADPEEMMAVDYSKLVPMLVKEIQDLRKRLAAAGI